MRVCDFVNVLDDCLIVVTNESSTLYDTRGDDFFKPMPAEVALMEVVTCSAYEGYVARERGNCTIFYIEARKVACDYDWALGLTYGK